MKRFTKRVEDFQCGHCGLHVTGDGYTNHCPACLWSLHVDINPGDRLNQCQELMEPVGIELDHGQYVISHRCTKCGQEKRNKASDKDDFDTLVALGRT